MDALKFDNTKFHVGRKKRPNCNLHLNPEDRLRAATDLAIRVYSLKGQMDFAFKNVYNGTRLQYGNKE